MPKSRPWSIASAPCRLEWGASGVLAVTLLLLGLLAAIAAIASELPWFAACPLAVAALAHAGFLALREWRGRTRTVVIPHNDAAATVDGEAVDALELRWRGSLAFLRWRDDGGRRHYLLGCPDNLRPEARRELRLAVAARAPVRAPRSMAP